MSQPICVDSCTVLTSTSRESTSETGTTIGLEVHFTDGDTRCYPDLGGDAPAVGLFAGRLIGQSLPPDVLPELVADYLEGRYGG